MPDCPQRPVDVGIGHAGGLPQLRYLPHSHRRWEPVATAESWARGSPLCNRYSYRFDRVEVAQPGGAWKRLRQWGVLADPGWRVRRSAASSFTARAA